MGENVSNDSDGTGGFDDQFSQTPADYMAKLDFVTWFRYYHLLKSLTARAPGSVLEIGAGGQVLKRIVAPLVERYEVLDINDNLGPDFVGDVREERSELRGRYDCIVAADVLEHIPFADLETALGVLRPYLRDGGALLLTIPHRRSHFLVMTPSYVPHVITVPTGFCSPGAFYRRFIKRKIWTDPHHCWEIGDGTVKRRDVEERFAWAGFGVAEFAKLVYVDYWILEPGPA